MLDLQNIGLVELNAQEVKEVEGGCILAIIGIAIGVYLSLAYYDHQIGHGN